MNTVYVVTPCRNALQTIDRTIMSVVNQAGDMNIRYHVQDGKSTDGTVARLSEWKERLRSGSVPLQCQGIRFSYASEPDSGMYDALVKGFAAMNPGADSFMTWINADDILMPGAFALAASLARQFTRNQLSWFGGGACIIRNDMVSVSFDRPIPTLALRHGICDGAHWDFLQQEGTFFRSWLWSAVNPAKALANMRLAGDWNIWRLMAAEASYAQVTFPLGAFRVSEGQLSASQRDGYLAEINAVVSEDARRAAFDEYSAAAPPVRWRIKAKSWRDSAHVIVEEAIDAVARRRHQTVHGANPPWADRVSPADKVIAQGQELAGQGSSVSEEVDAPVRPFNQARFGQVFDPSVGDNATAMRTGAGALARSGETGAILEQSRTRWQFGDWADLAALDRKQVESDVDRAKLMLLVAAAQSHAGDIAESRVSLRTALSWGADHRLAARVMLSAAENSLGRVAAALEDEASTRHFDEAIRLVEPRADVPLLARMRRIRESARLGLLPEAAKLMEEDLKLAAKAPAGQAAMTTILKSEIELLRQELALSLRRGQLYPRVGTEAAEAAGGAAVSRPADLEQRACSQLGQDLWVLEKTGHKRNGYFVEFGATDGLALSNTFLLESEFGWTGLLAEPNPLFLKDLQRNRTARVCDTVIGARTGDEVEFIFADVFGGIADYAGSDNHAHRREAYRQQGQVARLSTVSLDDFLSANGAPREIDYLSIDTEGSEYDILAAFPFDRWSIRLITVEHNFMPQREQIYQLLVKHGYRRTEAQWDDWYEKP